MGNERAHRRPSTEPALARQCLQCKRDSFSAFVEEYEGTPPTSRRYIQEGDHRHRTLYASIETSVRYLDADMRFLLMDCGFHARFLPETAWQSLTRRLREPKIHHRSSRSAPCPLATWPVSREIVTVRDGTSSTTCCQRYVPMLSSL